MPRVTAVSLRLGGRRRGATDPLDDLLRWAEVRNASRDSRINPRGPRRPSSHASPVSTNPATAGHARLPPV